MSKLKVLLILALWSWVLSGQPTQFTGGDNQGAGERQIKPQAVPTSSTAVTTVDAFIRQIVVANPTASAITFLVADRQASPIALVPTVTIAANTVYVVVIPALYWAPGGFTVIAGGSGLTYYASWRQ